MPNKQGMFDPFPLVRPLLHVLDPSETAHGLTLRAFGIRVRFPGQPKQNDPLLPQKSICSGVSSQGPLGLPPVLIRTRAYTRACSRMAFRSWKWAA